MAITRTEEEVYNISNKTYYCDYRGQNIPVKVEIERIIWGEHGKVGSRYTYRYDGYYKLYLSFGGSINGTIGSLQLFQNGIKVDGSVGFYAPEGECERELRMDTFPAKLNSESDEITCRIYNEAFIDDDGNPLNIIDTFKIKNILPNIAFEIIKAPNFSDEDNNVTISLNDWDTYKGKYNNNTLSDLTIAVDKIQAIISFDGITPNIVRDLTKWVFEQWEEEDGMWYEDEYMEFLYDFKNKTYTFTFTPEEKQALINAVTNGSSKEITFQIVTIPFDELNAGVPFYSNLKRTFTLIDASPILNPIVEDGNTKTAGLTGDINTFIKYHSEAVYAINAETKKNATIDYQKCICGDKSNDSPYGSIKRVESGTFLFTVVDSRNLITHQVIEKPLIPYIHLTANITKNSATPDGTMIFTISGNYYNGSFGAYDNTLIVRYSYRSADDEIFQDMAIVAPSKIEIKDNTYTATITVNGLDYRKDYLVQVNVWDLLENITTQEEYIGFTPIFDWGKNDFNFNIPVAYTEDDVSYSISDVAKKFDKLDFEREDFTLIKKLFNSVSNRYELPITHLGVSSNYSNVEVSLFLYGNTIRGYLTCKRKTALNAGNIANDYVCQVEFDSGGKVIGFGAVSFASGSVGTAATFQMDETHIYPDDGSVSPEQVGRGRFDINLCATGSSGDEWNAYFTFPCLIDLTKFEE